MKLQLENGTFPKHPTSKIYTIPHQVKCELQNAKAKMGEDEMNGTKQAASLRDIRNNPVPGAQAKHICYIAQYNILAFQGFTR